MSDKEISIRIEHLMSKPALTIEETKLLALLIQL